MHHHNLGNFGRWAFAVFTKVNEEEQDLLDSVGRGQWQPVPNIQQEIERYQRYTAAQYSLLNLGVSDVKKL